MLFNCQLVGCWRACSKWALLPTITLKQPLICHISRKEKAYIILAASTAVCFHSLIRTHFPASSTLSHRPLKSIILPVCSSSSTKEATKGPFFLSIPKDLSLHNKMYSKVKAFQLLSNVEYIATFSRIFPKNPFILSMKRHNPITQCHWLYFWYSDTSGTVSTDTSYRSRNCQLSSATSLGGSGSYSRGWLVYERVSYTGPCSDSNNRINGEETSSNSLLARYDRYKVDYRVISGAVLQRKSVSNAQQCARACDAYRSIRECQAFAFT